MKAYTSITEVMMTSIIDVAKDCNVAISTVSNVLSNKKYVSDEIREKVLSSCKKLDYKINVIASSMVTKRTHLIGLFLTSLEDKFDSFYSELIRGACTTSAKRGVSPVLYYNVLGERDLLNIFYSGRGLIDGALLLSPLEDDFRIKELKKDKLRHVVIGSPNKSNSDNEHSFYVDVDNEENTYRITKHLIEKGHKKILFINGLAKYTICKDRAVGFCRAMVESGLDNCKSNIKYVENGGDDVEDILNDHGGNVSAIIIDSNDMAKKVYDYASSRGLVIGKDIAVASLGGDINVKEYSDLTTIYVNYFEVASAAVNLLIDLIEDESKANNSVQAIECRSKIEIRASSDFVYKS